MSNFCTNNTKRILETSEFMKFFSYSTSLISIPIDIFGLYLIYFKTPRGMKTLKWTIFNVHLWGFLSDVLIGSLTIPFLFVPLIMGIPLGLLADLGVSPVIQIYAAFSCVAEVACAVTFLFENRQNNMMQGKKFKIERSTSRALFYAVNLVIPCLFMIPAFVDIPEQEESKKQGAKKFPCVTQEFYREDNFVLVTNTSLVSIPMSITLAYFVLQISIFFSQCLFQLFKSSAISSRTRCLQRQYFLSVCIQILVPVTTICSPIIYFICSIRFDYYNQTINNICCIVISRYGCISTIGTIIIYEPYRTFTLSLCFGKRGKPGEVGIVLQ